MIKRQTSEFSPLMRTVNQLNSIKDIYVAGQCKNKSLLHFLDSCNTLASILGRKAAHVRVHQEMGSKKYDRALFKALSALP